MKIKVAFLGTGTCISTPRNPSSIAISNGTEIILVDCGGGSYHQISRLNNTHFNYRNISAIFLTHFHVDHVSGLPDLFWGKMWDFSGNREAPLTLVGPQGLKDFYHSKLLPFLGDHKLPFPVVLHELSDREEYKESLTSVKSYKLSHAETSTGYLFTINGTRLGITGDTGYCDNLITLLNDSDIAILEWGIPFDSDYPGHITNTDMKKILLTTHLPKKIYFVHLYLLPGLTLQEQIKKHRRIPGLSLDRFIFPTDGDIIDIS